MNLGRVAVDWGNKNAADYVSTLMTRFGAPSAIDPTAGGMAIWKKAKISGASCLDRIEIHDSEIPACKPFKHLTFVTVRVNLHVPPSRLLEVLSLSSSLGYDALAKQLSCRSASLETCIAILALASQVSEANMTANYVTSNNLVAEWVLSSTDKAKAAQMSDLLCFNLKHQKGNPFPEGYYPLSEPEGCA